MTTILKIVLAGMKATPESNEMSDFYSEINASESDSEEEQDGDSHEILVFLFR
jgi:hypothetical protein